MGSTNGTASEPRFNFVGLGRHWGKRWMHTLTRTTKLQLELQKVQQQLESLEGDDAAMSRVEQQVALLDEFEALSIEQECLLAQVLADVPADWLSSDAPDTIEWSDPASLNYVQELRYPELIQALNAARQSSSKN